MFISRHELGNNVTQFTYWDEPIDTPWGILWTRIYVGETGKKVALFLNAMTVPYLTRRGVCTELINKLLEEVDIILAGSGSKTGGLEFLKEFGFKFNKETDIWSFVKRS